MRTKFISALGLTFLLASCVEDNFNDINNITPTPGQDIVFSANINTPKTRTVYGVEVDSNNDKTNDQVKVKWVHGDLVTVYGSACAAGRQQADYAVQSFVKDANGNPTTEVAPSTPNTDDGYSYADDLVKNGAYGVQWGESPTSDFYAVYPAVNDGAFEAIVENNVVTGVTVASKINAQQYLSFTSGTVAVTGIPYNSTGKAYGMNDALMYAYTPNATPTDANGNPKKVDLNFRPFSTVLNFSIPSWEATTDSGLAGNETGKSLVVNSITVTAPYGIAGDFNLEIKDGTATAGEGSSETITVVPSEQLKWEYGKSLDFSLFTIPVADKTIGGEGWTVSMELAGIGENGANLIKTFTFASPVNSMSIAAGKIHDVKVKSGFTVDGAWEYKTENWLTTVPRNVYISDLSLPGAWYATDSGYQGTATLDGLYKAGIRAFNIDCRLTLRPGLDVDNISNSSTYVDNLEHVSDEKYKDNDDATRYGPHTLVLACAGTEEYETRLSFATGKVTDIKKSVKEALIELGEYAALNTNEYIEVILTIAQKPKDFDHVFSSLYTFGTINPKMVLAAIAQTLNDDDVKGYLYGGTNGEVITPNTTINDVLGKVVVKVNMNTSDANIRAYNYSAPMLISEGSMASTSIGYTDAPVMVGVFDSMNTASMYWSDDYPTPDDNIAPMKYYYHQAQATSSAPTVAQRKAAILDILTKSYEIYKNNTHDAMFQIGIGGWTGTENNTSPSNLSKELNPYVYGIINSMLTGVGYDANGDGTAEVFTPAPVGAVLMNFATSKDNSTQQLIKAIIDLNGKYFLNSDITKPAWPTDGSGSGEGVLD